MPRVAVGDDGMKSFKDRALDFEQPPYLRKRLATSFIAAGFHP
jgi:hypothetical protein